jgi:hypothetical protein
MARLWRESSMRMYELSQRERIKRFGRRIVWHFDADYLRWMYFRHIHTPLDLVWFAVTAAFIVMGIGSIAYVVYIFVVVL